MYIASDVVLLDAVPKIRDGRVGDIVCSEDVDSFPDTIIRVDVLDSDDGQRLVIPRVTESKTGTRRDAEAGDIVGRNIEGDGHGEQSSIREPEGVHNAVNGGEVHWTARRRDTYPL